MKTYFLIPHIKIHNANAMSSPYTIGFPAMTAWLGAMHALQRRIRGAGFENIELKQLAVISHDCNLQVYKGIGDYRKSIIGTANPLKKSKKTGEFERPPFIEESRCHLNVSILIETAGVNGDNQDDFLQIASDELQCMKIAGGDIQTFEQLKIMFIDTDKDMRRLISKLMPGFVLIERRDLLFSEADDKDIMDELLNAVKVTYSSKENGDDSLSWQAKRKHSGWIVPIAVGFKGLSESKRISGQRDLSTEHRFAESVVTLGEFKMPYRFENVDEMMWKYNVDLDKSLYLCINQNK